jgi:hypothetical protein
MSNNLQQKTRRVRRQELREERRREEERLREVKRRRTLWISAIVGLVVVVVAAIVIGSVVTNHNAHANNSSTTTLTSDNPAYPVVDNIACQTSEQLAYHIHAHLSVYINGQSFALPAQIGIAPDSSCYYWLHTHDTSGIIHIESPSSKVYTLGTFFREWHDYFSALGYPSQLNSTSGWQVYVDGKPYNGDFHNIQLVAHRLITLAYNSPKATPDTNYNWGDL